MHLDDEAHMRTAFELAAKGYREGGCPIGGVLIDNTTGKILGKGHNALVQEGNPIVHGEMAAMRDAGRPADRHDTTMYTTVRPLLHGFRKKAQATPHRLRAQDVGFQCAVIGLPCQTGHHPLTLTIE